MNAIQPYYTEPFAIEAGQLDFTGASVFSGNGRHLLLNRDFGTTIMIDDEHFHQIQDHKLSDDLQFKLIQRGLMKVPGSPACHSGETILPAFFIIDLTQACNFRCAYCFRHLEGHVRTISNENLDKIVNYLADHCQKHKLREINIQPWGGEPLIAWDKICRMQDILLEKGINTIITIESNAGLITKELAAEAGRRNIRIGVSIDGTREVHDKHRSLANGKPSFDKMFQGLQNLRENGYGLSHGIISVVTRYSLPHLEEILEYFAVDLKIDRFKLNIVKDSPVMKDKGLCLSGAEIADYQERLLKKLIELNRRGYAIVELNVLDKLQNLLTRNKSNICISRGCQGGTKMIAIDQDGLIFPCDMTDYKEEAVGSVHDGVELVEMLENARKQSDFFLTKESEECKSCPWWFFCKGGCTTAIKYKNGKVAGIDNLECVSNQAMYPALVDMILNDPEAVGLLTKNKIIIG
jgi:uncharacterized protein